MKVYNSQMCCLLWLTLETDIRSLTISPMVPELWTMESEMVRLQSRCRVAQFPHSEFYSQKLPELQDNPIASAASATPGSLILSVQLFFPIVSLANVNNYQQRIFIKKQFSITITRREITQATWRLFQRLYQSVITALGH